jgi:stearoyl-CoA desaturase (delta-9 desaturase)
MLAIISTKEEEIREAKRSLNWGQTILKDYSMDDFHKLCKNNPTKKYTILSGKVLDVTDFPEKHPGSERLIKMYVGKDMTPGFYGRLNNHTKSARMMADKMAIGQIISLKKEE